MATSSGNGGWVLRKNDAKARGRNELGYEFEGRFVAPPHLLALEVPSSVLTHRRVFCRQEVVTRNSQVLIAMYPVMLDIERRHCLVVGGGSVALRKVEGLLADGAVVTVVASEPLAALHELAATGRIVLEHRPYSPKETATYALVFAATDDRPTNRQVFEDAQAANVWVNVADDPEICSFHLPARVRRGTFQLAIASAGEAPFAVRRLRQLLEKVFDNRWGDWMKSAGRFRRRLLAMELPPSQQEERCDRFFSATVNTEKIRVRLPTDEEEHSWLKNSD